MSDTCKLIIIEDEKAFANLVARSLTGLVDSVAVVDNWESAFAHIKEEKDDVAWIDLRMPGSSEEEAIANTAKLRSINSNIVIIVGSGFITPHIRAQLDHAGVDGVFRKDAGFKPQQVAALIILGMMRANKRTPHWNDALLNRGLDWMDDRFPDAKIP